MFFVSRTTPPFDALYELPPAVPSIPSTLASVTIDPRSPSTDLLGNHASQRCLRDEESPGQIHADDAFPLGALDPMHRSPAGDPGRMHDTIEASVHGRED